jgi:glycosyltransferase involved in cell wall biosynthesis
MGVYNGLPDLEEAIESVLNQTYRDFEFIIINDGSKDASGTVIDRYAVQDGRIVAIHHDNMGHANSLNKALGLAKGEYIARMDADDISLPTRFEKQIEYMDAHSDIAVLGTSICLIDEDGKQYQEIIHTVSSEDIAKEIFDANPLAHPSVLIRKNIILEMNGYRPVFDPAEDYELWLRISEKYKIANLPEILLLYRQHSEKLSFKYSQYQTLGTHIAKLASQMRTSGKADPTENLETISEKTLDLFDLTSIEKAEYLFKTYQYSLWLNVENRNDQALVTLLSDMKVKHSNNSYYNALACTVWMELCRLYFLRQEFRKSYIYLLKILPYQPGKALYEAAYNTKKIISFYYDFWHGKLYHFAKRVLK